MAVRIEQVINITKSINTTIANTTDTIWAYNEFSHANYNHDYVSKDCAWIVWVGGYNTSNTIPTMNKVDYSVAGDSTTQTFTTSSTNNFVGEYGVVLPHSDAGSYQSVWFFNNPHLCVNTYFTGVLSSVSNTWIQAILLSGVDPNATANSIQFTTENIEVDKTDPGGANTTFSSYINSSSANNLLVSYAICADATAQHFFGDAIGNTDNQLSYNDVYSMDFACGFKYASGNTPMTYWTNWQPGWMGGSNTGNFSVVNIEVPAAASDRNKDVQIHTVRNAITTAGTGLSTSFTCYATGDTYFVYGVSTGQNSGYWANVNSVTYGGIAMEKIIGAQELCDAYYTDVSFWGIANPPLGNSQVVVTCNASADIICGAGALLTNVDVDNPVSAQTSILTNNQINHTITIPSDNERGMVFSMASIDDATTNFRGIQNSTHHCGGSYPTAKYNSSTVDTTYLFSTGKSTDTTHRYDSQTDIRDALIVGFQVNPIPLSKRPYKMIKNYFNFSDDGGQTNDWRVHVPTYSSNALLVVMMFVEETAGSNYNTTTLTYDGVEMDIIKEQQGALWGSHTDPLVGIYGMKNPPWGNNLISVTYSTLVTYNGMAAYLIEDVDFGSTVTNPIDLTYTGNNGTEGDTSTYTLSLPTTGVTNDDIFIVAVSGEAAGDWVPDNIRIANATGESFTVATAGQGVRTDSGFTAIAYITGDKILADPQPIFIDDTSSANVAYRIYVNGFRLANGVNANLDITSASSNGNASNTGLEVTVNTTPWSEVICVAATGDDETLTWYGGCKTTNLAFYGGTSAQFELYWGKQGRGVDYSNNGTFSVTWGATTTGQALSAISFTPQGDSYPVIGYVGNTVGSYDADIIHHHEHTNTQRESLQICAFSHNAVLYPDITEPDYANTSLKSSTFIQYHYPNIYHHGQSVLHWSNDKGPMAFEWDQGSGNNAVEIASAEIKLLNIDPLPFLTKIKVI